MPDLPLRAQLHLYRAYAALVSEGVYMDALTAGRQWSLCMTRARLRRYIGAPE